MTASRDILVLYYSQYGAVRQMAQIVARELELKGFLLYTYSAFVPAALQTNLDGLRDGWLTTIEHKKVGLAHAGELFCELMSGRTLGKAVLEMDLPELA